MGGGADLGLSNELADRVESSSDDKYCYLLRAMMNLTSKEHPSK
jgi:hypothetical protein